MRMERVMAWMPRLCIIMMAGSLLAVQPGGLFRFVWIKVLLVIIAVIAGLFSPPDSRLPLAVKAALAGCALWITVAMLLSDTPAASIAGRWPRYEGLLMLGVYLAVFTVGAKVLGGAPGSHRRTLLGMSLAGAGIVVFVLAVLESAGLRPLGGAADVRPGATLGNATDQGLIGVIITGVLLAQGAPDRAWAVWLRRAGLLAGAGVAVLSGSRAALAALLAVAVFGTYTWMRSRSWTGPKITAGTGLAAAGIAAGVLLAPASRERLLSTATVDGRWLLWDQTLGLIADIPLSGVGPSGFVDALPGYLGAEWARTVGDSFPADSPHSWPLQTLAAGGFPLLALVVVLIAVSAAAVIRRMRESRSAVDRRYLAVVLVTVAAYALALLTHFTSIGTTGLAAFLCGGLVGSDAGRDAFIRTGALRELAAEKLRLVPRMAGALLVIGGLAVAIPATVAEWSMGAGARAAAAGNHAQAEQEFKQAWQLRSWDSDTALLAAQAFAGPATEGDQQAARYAVNWGTLARERTPQSQEAGTALALGYLYSGDVPKAKDLLDSLVADSPYTAALYVHRGVAHFGLGRPSDAIADLEYAASLDPALETPWRVLSNIHQRLGNSQEASFANRRADEIGGR
ncbi:O-antigen ligase family protein [Arthrobacter sp. Z4-13]